MQSFVTVGYLSLTSNTGTNPAALVLQQDGSSYEWALDCGDNHNAEGNAGDILVNQGSGVLQWTTPTATPPTVGDIFEIVTSSAGSNSISAPTKPHKTINKTAITGGGDTDTLPDTAGLTVGQMFILKDTSGTAGTNNWTIATFGAETIDGSATMVIEADRDSRTIQWDGTSYNII